MATPSPTIPPRNLRCAACGREEPNVAFRFCQACGAPLAVNQTWLARANLAFLLEELRAWKASGRLPAPLADDLLAEYAARREAQEAPWSAPPAAAPPPPPALAPPATVPAPVPPPIPVLRQPPQPAPVAPAQAAPATPQRGGLVAFVEDRNVSILAVVGALLLLAGLVALVRWQWGTGLGKGIVMAVLLGLTTGLYLGGRRLSTENPVSGLALSALGALIAPLNPVAAKLFGVFGRSLSWDVVGFLTAAVCSALYYLTMRRTRHPLFASLLAVAGACTGLFGARLLFPGAAHLTYAAAFLPLSALYFATVHRLRRAREEADTPLAFPFLIGAHGLVAATVVLTLLDWSSVWERGPYATALVAALIAALYGVVAVAFRMPALAYAAAAAALIAGQLLVPAGAGVSDRAVLAAVTGALLAVAALLHRRRLAAAHPSAAPAAAVYDDCGLLFAGTATLPFVIRLSAGYLVVRPVTDARLLGEALLTCTIAAVLFARSALRRDDATRLYPAFAAAALGITAAFGLVAPGASWLAAAGVPGLVFVAASVGAAYLLRRGGRDAFADAARHAGLLGTAVSALLPWYHLFSGTLPPPLRNVNLLLVLPGLALVNGLAACASRTARDRRDAYVHGAALSLGSLALFFGMTRADPPGVDGGLLTAATGGGVALALGTLGLLWPGLRRALALDAAALASAAALPLLFLLFDGDRPLPLSGVLCLIAAAWAVAARGRDVPALLYPAGAALLIAGRILAGPWNDWGMARFRWEADETRWLLPLVPAFAALGWFVRARLAAADFARPLYHLALAAAVWTGGGQVVFALGARHAPASPPITLWLLAAGLLAYGAIAQRPRFADAALVPAVLGYLFAGPLPAWVVVSTLTLFGLAYLWVAWELSRSAYAWAGGLALFGAYVRLLGQDLPQTLGPVWALWLAPFFVILFALGQVAGRDADGEQALRRPLHGLALGLSLVCLALHLLDPLRGRGASPETGRTLVLLTALVYAALYAIAAFVRDSTPCLQAGVAIITLGVFLRAGGYPSWNQPLAPVGLWLTVLACGWLGGAALLAGVRRIPFAETLTQAALVVATLGAATAFLGVTAEGQGRWTVYALVVAGTLYGVVGVLRQNLAGAHATFAAYFLAFALFLYDLAGLSIGTADFYLIPVGLYLIAIGWLVARARPDAGGARAANRLYAAGLLIALAPTFLAAWLDTAWYHSFLLIAESVAAVYWGIARRVRVFLGVGIAFLVALLGVKFYDPLRQINFGIYLTLLGAAILVSVVYFEKRRDEVLRWARAARGTFEGWE